MPTPSSTRPSRRASTGDAGRFRARSMGTVASGSRSLAAPPTARMPATTPSSPPSTMAVEDRPPAPGVQPALEGPAHQVAATDSALDVTHSRRRHRPRAPRDRPPPCASARRRSGSTPLATTTASAAVSRSCGPDRYSTRSGRMAVTSAPATRSTPWARASNRARARRGWAISTPNRSPGSSTVTRAAPLGEELGQFDPDQAATEHDHVLADRHPALGEAAHPVHRRRHARPAPHRHRGTTADGELPAGGGSSPASRPRRSSPVSTWGRSAPGMAGRSRRAPVATTTTSAPMARTASGVASVPRADVDVELEHGLGQVAHQLGVHRRRQRREPGGAPQLVGLLEQRHPVAPQRRDPRRLHASGATPDHGDGPRGRGRRDRALVVVAQLGVHRADGRAVPEVLGHADVAVDAGADGCRAGRPGAWPPISGSASSWRPMATKSSWSLGDVALGGVGKDPADADHRHSDRLLHPGGQRRRTGPSPTGGARR